jgi:hypothetical protein
LEYSAGTVASPHLFKKVAVQGICVGWIFMVCEMTNLVETDEHATFLCSGIHEAIMSYSHC